jgi:truncated hemoglobin YjbI
MRTRTIVWTGCFFALGALGFACGNKPPPKEPAVVETIADAGPDVVEEAEAPAPKSLYERLGKQDGITKIVESFTKALQGDAKLTKKMSSLKGPKLDRFKKDLVDVICVESGGADAGADCKYEGRFMKEALGPKSKLKEDEWQAVLADLRSALDQEKVGNDEQQDLAAALGKFRDDVVEAKKGKKNP